MLGIFDRIEQAGFLEKKERELQSARVTGKTECQKSGFCCYQRPAVPTPNEVREIAAYLKLTTKDFIKKYLTIDKDRNSIYHLRFVSQDYLETAGRFLINYETFNRKPCVFLTEKHLCQIQDVKPKQCQEHSCWQKGLGFKAENQWENNILEIEFGIDGKEQEEETFY